jgi:hypothetical protein
MKITIVESAVINAPAAHLYSIIADYNVGHPAILPDSFTGITVLKGGYGEGTETRVGMKVMGKEQFFEQRITEPEPGRVLKEVDMKSGTTTLFIFEEVESGTKVTFHTEYFTQPGIAGRVEGWFIPRYLRPVYRQELQNLAAYAVQVA